MRVLLAGETWMTYGVHVKGFDAYYTGGYASGAAPLIDALEAGGVTVDHLENHLATTRFPRTQKELLRYDVVILSDIGADTLLLHPDVFERGQRVADPIEALDEFVTKGGGLLMIGGYMSFSGYDGRARYHNTPLAETLPVRMTGFDDRIEKPGGVHPEAISDHRVLDGVPANWPYFLGYNRLVAKDHADVLLQVGTDPFLIVQQYGAGRSAAFASDCSPHWGSQQFTGWEAYGRFWVQLLRWLASSADS